MIKIRKSKGLFKKVSILERVNRFNQNMKKRNSLQKSIIKGSRKLTMMISKRFKSKVIKRKVKAKVKNK